MGRTSSHIRLYVDHPLGQAERVELSREQAHYLFGVMRLGADDDVSLFNGRDGQWRARVAESFKRGGVLECLEQTAPQVTPPDLWLLCAPIRKERMSFVVEKAVELGAARIVPVQTEFTQDAKRVRVEKLQAIAVEAAEQCGATYVPQVAEVVKFGALLDRWDSARSLVFCDEGLAGDAAFAVEPGPAGILIGPEGGFSDVERARLQGFDAAVAVSLGPRILRAETAAIVALTLWQSQLGDWV